MKAKIIKLSGKVVDVEVEDYKDMQKAVDGFIERLPVEEKHGVTVYCNEEGRVHELPINMTACMWLLRNGMYPSMDYPIHGEVLVLGLPDEEGSDTDVPEELMIQELWVEPSFEIFTGDEAKEMMGF